MPDSIIGKVSVGDGATFTPSVSSAGELSWTNNKNLENPATVDLAQAVIDKNILAPINSPALTGTPTAPTPTAGDNSTKIATTAFVNNYLPLSGGTMTGAINVSGYLAAGTNNATNVRIAGGANASNGALIEVFGKDHSGAGGRFYLTANNGTNSTALIGFPYGSLTWGGQNILTASNYNSYALPLSGGTINGDLSFTGGSRKITFNNGKSHVIGFGNGVYMYGDTVDKQSSFVAFTNENGSGFQINAGDGTTQKRMVGKPDGTLTWDSNNILTTANGLPLSGGTMTGNIAMSGKTIHFVDGSNPAVAGSGGWIGGVGSGLRIAAENYGLSLAGGRIELRGRNYSIDAGRFDIVSANTNNEKVLTGKPDGTLTWDGNNVITSALTGNVLSANGTSTTVSAETTLCSISTHDAGVWLIIGFVDLGYGGTASFYGNQITTANHGYRGTRNIPDGGGGNINVLLTQLDANELVQLKGFQQESGTMRGSLNMVRLA